MGLGLCLSKHGIQLSVPIVTVSGYTGTRLAVDLKIEPAGVLGSQTKVT